MLRSGQVYPWYVVFVLFLMMLFAFLDRSIIYMMVDPIREDLGISEVQISLLTGLAFGSIYVVSGVFLGWAADRFNRRWIIAGGVLFWGLATVGCGLARNFVQLFIGRAAVGVGEATLLPAAYSMLADTFPPKRLALASGIIMMGAAFGGAISYTIGGAVASAFGGFGESMVWPLLGEVKGWHAAFIIVGLPGPLLALLVLTLREPQRKGSLQAKGQTAQREEIVSYLKQHWCFYLCVTCAFGMMGMGMYAMQSWGPAYLSRVFGWSGLEIGMSFGPVLLAGSVVALLGGGLVADFFYSRGVRDAHFRIYSIASMVAWPLVIFMIAANDPWIFLISVFFWYAISGGYASAAISGMQLVTPNEYRGRIIAIFLAASSLAGMGLGPVVVAMLTQYVFQDDKMVGWSLGVALACIYPTSAILFWIAARQSRLLQTRMSEG